MAAIGSSVMRMSATSTPGTGRPTQMPSSGSAEQLVAADGGDGQRLGRAVRREDLRAVGEHRERPALHRAAAPARPADMTVPHGRHAQRRCG